MTDNSVLGLLDSFLIKKQQEEFAKPYHHKWRPSSFGMCFRSQYWTRQHLPMTNPPNVASLRRFWFGHLGHKMLQDQLDQKLVEVTFETDDQKGTTDFISDERFYKGDDRIVDFKFTWGYNFKSAVKEGYDIGKEKTGYCLQAVDYAMQFNKEYAEILMLDRGSVESISFMLRVDEWRDAVNSELGQLRHYWDSHTLPPAQPRAKWNCTYCNHALRCKDIESKGG